MLMLLRRSGVVDVGNDSSSSACTFLVSIFRDSFVVVVLILRSVCVCFLIFLCCWIILRFCQVYWFEWLTNSKCLISFHVYSDEKNKFLV